MSPQGTAWPAEPRDPKAVSVDLYHGVPGVVLFFLEAGRLTGDRRAMDPTFPRLMPNFSHGTAGVAYFLATLYMESQRKEFLDAAIAGARYLQSIANTEGNVCLIHHHEPDGKNLYYLGWRHGPAGTARLFYRLYQSYS